MAEELNLNRAAIRLHMSQPPLTRRIQRLERELGVELFRRTAGGMELTEAGTVFLERAYRIVALSTRAVERTRLASDGEIGHLSVGYYDPAILNGIPELIRGFLDQHRYVTVSFELIAKHGASCPGLAGRAKSVVFTRPRRRCASAPAHPCAGTRLGQLLRVA